MSLEMLGSGYTYRETIFGNTWLPDSTATLSPVAEVPHDAACEELFVVHRSFYGGLDRPSFDHEMIANRRLVIRLEVNHLYGIVSTTGRRPVPTP
jgi:hypothetical protein